MTEERWVRAGTNAWDRQFMLDRVATAFLQTRGDLDDLTTLVTSAAMVEYLLRELIGTKANLAILESNNRPMSYSGMIRLASALDALPAELRAPLSRLGRVRNSFAHDIGHRLCANDVTTLRTSLSSRLLQEVDDYEETVVANGGLPRGPSLSVRCAIICIIDALQEVVQCHDTNPFE